jgi:hypothetical protein
MTCESLSEFTWQRGARRVSSRPSSKLERKRKPDFPSTTVTPNATMTTETQAPSPPELTILNRLSSIPLVSSSLSTLHTRLSANAYTAPPYHTAAALSAYARGTAVRAAAPILPRVAPLVARADGLANAAVDAVQTRYPYPFEATPEKVVQDLHASAEGARGVANKTLDDRVRAPAGRVVVGIDQVGFLSHNIPYLPRCLFAINECAATPGYCVVARASVATPDLRLLCACLFLHVC